MPIAIKDEVDVAGEVTSFGTDAFSEPAKEDCEMVRRLREAGAIIVGLTLLPEMAICGFTESATYGRDPQPLESPAHPGRLERRLRRGGRRGPGPDRLGRRRRRLDPDPGRLLRPLRPEALARPGLAGARARRLERPRGLGCLSRTVLDTALWLDVIAGGSQEAEAPPPPERPFVESAKTAARQAAGRLVDRRRRGPLAPPTVSDEVKGAVADAAEMLRVARPRGRPEGPRLGRDRQQHHAALPARRRRDRRRSARTPSASNGARAASAGSAGSFPTRSTRRRSARAARRTAPAINAIFDTHDVLVTAGDGRHGAAGPPLGGAGAIRTVLGMSRFYPYCVPWNHLGNPAMAVPFGFGADGMPLSIQVIGRRGDEATLLSLAAQIEAERPWADKIPSLA